MNMKTNIQHTYSVNISDQVPTRNSKTQAQNSIKRIVEERQTINEKVITHFSLSKTPPLKLVMCFVPFIS